MELLFSQYLPSLLSLVGIMMIALISPGPDFAVIVRNSLVYSRKTALLTALGIALGIMVHVFYTLFGLGLVIKESTWLFQGIKFIGAGYLIYVGYKSLRAKKTNLAYGNMQHARDISPKLAILSGFLTNALNPKCMLFIMSLFSVIIPLNAPPLIMVTYGIIIFVETLAWFSFVAFCLSGKRTRERFNAAGHWIERITGGILVMLAVKLFFTV